MDSTSASVICVGYRARKDPSIERNNRNKEDRSDWDMDSATKAEDGKQKPTGLARIVDKHTDKFSMSGVSYIKSTKNPVVKFVWSILLIAALGAMGYHLYRLVSTFLEYKKQTSIELSFDTLLFPAVTICNVNPMRMSQIDLASDELRDLIDSVDPSNLTARLNDWTPEFDDLDDYFGDEDIDFSDDTEDDEDMRRRRRKRQANQKTVKVRNSNFLDDVNVGYTDERQWNEAINSFYAQEDGDSWEAEGKTSAFYEVEQNFRENFAWETAETRAEMGHQISDMLLQCSFAGRQCVARNFTRLLTTDYGNCYTIQYNKFVSRKSGPKYGLELKLYLQTDEYVPGITTSKGIHVVIHDQDTYPFPEDEGIAVKAGTETRIGLKLIEVSRLGGQHGDCTSPEEFKKDYRIKYTRTACQNIRLFEKTVSTCGCYDVLAEETRKLLRRTVKNTTWCESAEQIKCVQRVANSFDNSEDSKSCHSPCSEKTFAKTVSAREWPNTDFANLLVETVCKNSGEDCNVLRSLDVEKTRSEFVKLVIFYEDLNYEKIEESPAYEIDQFLSDIGGTIGLYIGLSVLAIFEVINLIVDMLTYLCCGCCRRK
ncbi:hypothetical protein RRG08_048784 [Elysia crispata]|uniref:Uncharacterized protein n=1 Tax=Elysia crispata TaxID=231223 RepID=A0AAE1AMT4_9GAST|nr:hypothetical protein RRG08_048784 [Elysia crispata]